MAKRFIDAQTIQLAINFARQEAPAQVLRREKNGAIYTQSWVVDMMLDLAGYTPDQPLHQMFAVEPSAGDGAFLVPMACRLIEVAQKRGIALLDTQTSLLAYELDEASANAARNAVIKALTGRQVPAEVAGALAQAWVRTGDYLLDAPNLPPAHVVIGNPPYIRLEDMDPATVGVYRAMYGTMRGRADIYVGFYEAALRQLAPEGVCVFICADRWMLNQYGGELREFITRSYAVEVVLELHTAEAFADDVTAYPAVTVIRRGQQSLAVVASAERIAQQAGGAGLATFLHRIHEGCADIAVPRGMRAARIESWFTGADPWPCVAPDKLALLKQLEVRFPALQDEVTGTRVGIGLATGADGVFITSNAALVEASRLLPMALVSDRARSRVHWSGHYLVNPWDDEGLVSLARYPRLRAYYMEHEAQLKQRNVARRSGANWFRTIDRLNYELVSERKLYIPDIKNWLDPILDEGGTYPHHNLYWVTSETWDLEVLGGLLLSSVVHLFIECYAVCMRGGYLRFQAQYLRRVRVPRPQDITEAQAARLIDAFRRRDRTLASRVAMEIYGIAGFPGGGEFPVTESDINKRLQGAVQQYWNTRELQRIKNEATQNPDAGSRGAVTGGAQMAPIEDLVTDIIVAAGIDRADIKTRTKLELPGYYRAEKKWDLLVVSREQLVLALEFKGQVGPSFGNNANNRVEEALGSAADIWTAYRERLLGRAPEPFLGYFFVLEDSPQVHKPVKNAEPYFQVDSGFKDASYAKRYELMCQRLVLERMCRSVCFLLATNTTPTTITQPAEDLSFQRFIAAIRGHILTFLESQKQ